MPRLSRLPGSPLLRALGVALAAAVCAAPPASAAPRALIGSDFPDPDVLAADGAFYAYATNAAGSNVQAATAPAVDGTWTALPDALPALGAWAQPGLTWAPDVSRRADGDYLMYYTARDTASGRQCVGAAVSASPAGPFQPVGDGPLVCPAADGGAIDPESFTDTDGTRYLLFKNDGNAIGADTWLQLQRTGADGTTLEGDPVRLLKQDRAEEQGLVEAPTLVRHGGSYVLLYSAGHYDDASYFTGSATAPAITGPYTKSAQPVLSSEATGITGPGGQDVISADGRDWILFHGILAQDPLVRGMFADTLSWSGDTPVAD